MNKLERTIAADAAIKAVLLRRRRRRRINALSLALTVGMISAVTALTLIHPAPSTVNVPGQPRPAVAEPPKTVYDTPPSPQQTQETEPERVVRRHETVEEVTSFVDHTIPQINMVTVTEPQRQERRPRRRRCIPPVRCMSRSAATRSILTDMSSR